MVRRLLLCMFFSVTHMFAADTKAGAKAALIPLQFTEAASLLSSGGSLYVISRCEGELSLAHAFWSEGGTLILTTHGRDVCRTMTPGQIENMVCWGAPFVWDPGDPAQAYFVPLPLGEAIDVVTEDKTEHKGKDCGSFMHITQREDKELLGGDLGDDIFSAMMDRKIATGGVAVSDNRLAEQVFVFASALYRYIKEADGTSDAETVELTHGVRCDCTECEARDAAILARPSFDHKEWRKRMKASDKLRYYPCLSFGANELLIQEQFVLWKRAQSTASKAKPTPPDLRAALHLSAYS